MKRITAILVLFGLLLSQVAVFAEETAETEDVIRYYVSPDGSDINPGTEELPFATIDAARQAVQKTYKEKPIEVLIKAGTYRLTERIEFTSLDSGTKEAPITYKNYGDGEVIITGAKQIDLSKFTPITDKEILERLPEASRGRVGQVDLGAQGFTLNELTMKNEEGNSPFVEDYKTGYTPIIMGLYLNGYEQQLAKWPNRNFEYIDSVIGTDTMTYTQTNPSRWTKAKDAFVAGYMYSEWTGGWQPIKSIDTEKRTITVNTGGERLVAGHRWSAINLLEEIDIPGEWYLDRENLILYYYPEKYIDVENDVLEFGILPGSSGYGAIDVRNCNFINFEGLTVEKTYCSGILFDACNDCTVTNCYVHDVGGYGISSANFGKRMVFEENTVANCASYCIRMNYQGWAPYTESEIKDLTSTGNVIRNNHMYNGGNNRYGMVYISTAQGIGTIYEHNIAHKGINSAIDNAAPLAVTRYNELYNAVRETADAGAIYSGRTWSWYGPIIEYNYIHDLGDKEFQAGNLVDCIFWDDTISGQTARYNILRPNSKTRTYGVISGGGRDNDIIGNIIIDSDQSIGMQDRTTSLADGRTYNDGGCWNDLTTRVSWKDSVYLKTFPGMLRTYEEMNSNGYVFYPHYNNISDNVIINTADINYSNAVKDSDTTIMENNYVGTGYDIFVDPENQDFRVKNSAKEELGLGEGVLDENFDIDLIGIQTEVMEVDDSFSKTYPKNGDKGLDAASVTLSWQKAPFADEYDYKVATDPQMQNVVAYGTTIYSNTVIEKLEKNTSYYWTVTAKNISRQLGKEWEAEGVPYMFTTASYDILVTDGLKKKIQDAKDFAESMTEGTELGQYKVGSKQVLLDKIEEIEIISKMTSGEQITINTAEIEMEHAIEVAKSSINVGYNGTIDTTDVSKWETTMPDCISAVQEGDAIRFDKVQNDGIYATKDVYNGAGVYTFELKATAENGWFAFGLRHSNIDSGNIYSAPAGLNNVFIIVKNDVFELQSRNSDTGGQTLMVTEPNNGIFKNNEWNRIEFGAIPAGDGIYCTLKVNDQVIYQYLDNINPVRTEGVFTVQPIKDEPMYIRGVQDAPVGEFEIPESVLGNGNEQELIYTTSSTEYREVGNWTLGTLKGYNSETVRVTSDINATADFDVYPQGNTGGTLGTYEVYYYNVPSEDADKNVSVEFTNLYTSYTRKLDTSKGEAGWRKLGTFYFADASARAYMNIKFIPSGSGQLPISAIKLVKTEDTERNFSQIFYQQITDPLILRIGEKTAFKDIEATVYDVAPVIVDSRTLVPLRLISESFGAAVEWNEESRQAVINIGNDQIVFTADSAGYTVNGEEKQLDCSASIMDDRMMIPVRALAESIGKTVLWDDETKVIIIADEIKVTEEEYGNIFKACADEFDKIVE